ncbi:hypothetical protein DFP72DRAFT_1076384 [Ephemerocybe angulata]|uniref:Uncharacterized protein n=1 Tax=Ephemerocybe angulata TaxID=980116 RepID=A0A8H6LWD2_9AGAR|nr:hypothetical protein DFP72DRAFT_1076384 [Tulosesus angulatus]
MDDYTLEDLKLIFYQFTIQEYLLLSASTVLLYYYATTFEYEVCVEEPEKERDVNILQVSRIWPQPSFRAGKILYLLARYGTILRIMCEILGFTPMGRQWNLGSCDFLQRATTGFDVIAMAAAEATLWLCLFALLEGKRRYLILMATAFLAFIIPVQVLQGIFTMELRAIPPSELYMSRRYACEFADPSPRTIGYMVVATFIVLARTTAILIVAVITLIVRYRKQNNSLLNVIRREGGFYYMFAFLLNFIGAMIRTPTFPLKDNYGFMSGYCTFFIFADRLLLNMQRTNDPGTQEIVTTILFGGDKLESQSTEDGIYLEEVDGSPHQVIADPEK